MAELYKETPLWHYTTPVALAPSQTLTLTMPSTYKTAASALLFTQKIMSNNASLYQFNVNSSINLKISYNSTTLKDENFTILFNRDRDLDGGYFENTSKLYLKGNDINLLELTFTNNSTDATLYIEEFSIFESDDVQVTTIAKVLKEETISADLIQATSVFATGIFAQILRTNVLSRSARYAHAGDVVNYINIEDWTVDFNTDVLSDTEEQFSITTQIAGQSVTYDYWYSSITGKDAYKYLTTIDPRDKYPDISDSNRNAFKFMVLAPESTMTKLTIRFAEDELGNLTPSIIYGAGGSGGRQRGYSYKNSNGFYHIYETASGETIGIIMDESGVHITGWTDQHCEAITFYDNGVKLKFTGEEEHSFEYVVDNNDVLTGIIQDQLYLTTISTHSGNL